MLYLECYPDTLLVRTLGVPRHKIRHAHGKGNVVGRLEKCTEEAVGLVDQDPQSAQPGNLDYYQQMDCQGNLRLLAHRAHPNRRLVAICPILEEWLYQRATACGLKPQDYGLPHSAEDLKKIPHYEQKPKFQEFLQNLCQLDPEISRLRQWLGECPC